MTGLARSHATSNWASGVSLVRRVAARVGADDVLTRGVVPHEGLPEILRWNHAGADAGAERSRRQAERLQPPRRVQVRLAGAPRRGDGRGLEQGPGGSRHSRGRADGRADDTEAREHRRLQHTRHGLEVGAQLLWVGEMCLGPRGVAAGGDRGEQREPPQGTTLTSGHAGPPKCGRWRRRSERARRGGWSSLKPTPWADDRTVTPRTNPAGRTNPLPR